MRERTPDAGPSAGGVTDSAGSTNAHDSRPRTRDARNRGVVNYGARERPTTPVRVRRFDAADRGATSVLTYALALLVVSLLTTAVFVGVGGVVEDQHEDSLYSSMDVVGHRLASDVRTADRLATTAGAGGTVELTSDLPVRAAGSQYVVTVTAVDATTYELVLETTDPDVRVVVAVRSRTPIREGTVQGGTLEIRYDASANELVIARV